MRSLVIPILTPITIPFHVFYLISGAAVHDEMVGFLDRATSMTKDAMNIDLSSEYVSDLKEMLFSDALDSKVTGKNISVLYMLAVYNKTGLMTSIPIRYVEENP